MPKIDLSPNKIDFSSVITGQLHDNYPPEGGQARFDHMRTFLIGLLSNQSDTTQPVERRDGTLWFDTNSMTLKIYSNGQWHMLSDVIAVSQQNDDVITLSEWYDNIVNIISSSAAPVVFSGVATSTTQVISIPTSLRQYLYGDSRAFVYVNGMLIDPRNSQILPSNNPTYIQLSHDTLNNSDTFTVEIKRIASATFYTPTVNVP